jgi:N-acyl-D-amino-acid deacylase
VATRCDLLIRNGTVIDGTGAGPFRGDLAVSGSRIAALGDLGGMAAEHGMDAAGRVVAPGFIDVHTHDDHVLLEGAMMPKVSQGVTTVVAGNCGVSLAPLVFDGEPPAPLRLLGQDAYRFASFRAYVEALEARPAAVNAVLLVGHSTLRVGTMSEIDRPATCDEIAAMRGLLREALDAGAAGFSTGLFYPAGRAAPMTEVIALLDTLRGTGAVYATHMRDEADGVEESLAESFETASAAGVPLIVSHHKCMGRANFGRSSRTLALIERARRERPVGLDVYPYTAGSTELLPALIGQASRVIVTWSRAHPELAGRDLADIAAAWDIDQTAAAVRLQPAGAIYFMMDEADVQRIITYPHSMIGSDGLPHDEHPHPRLWGTFPRVLGRYVRDLKLLTLNDAVHRMTGLAAAQFRLVDRGVLRPGAFADIVVFDPATVADRATFEEPKSPAAGIDLVVVNGEIVYQDSHPTGARPGRVLRRDGPTQALAG